MDYGPQSEQYQKLAKDAINTLDHNSPERCIINGEDYLLCYQKTQGIVFMTMTDRSYSKKMAFEYLQDVSLHFFQEYQHNLHTLQRQYSALSFDQQLEKIRKKFLDPNHDNHSLKRLNTNLLDIQGIMQKNIMDVVHRGKRLGELEDTTNQLLLDSERYKEQAKYTNWMATIRQYAPFIAIGVIVVLVLLWRLLF